MWKCREVCGSVGREGKVQGGMWKYKEGCGSIRRDVEV